MHAGLALCLMLSTAASAAPGAPSPGDPLEIIVQGTRDRDRQIRAFIKDLTPVPIHGQLARFETNVCPIAVGLSRAQNVVVASRMRGVAGAAGIPVAKPDCRPNVILIVTGNKAALLDRLWRARPYMLPTSWTWSRIQEVGRDPAPAVAWMVEDRQSANGVEHYGAEVPVNRMTGAASRLTPTVRPYFLASVVVIQSDALAGLTTTQLADYAAMRSFVRTDPARLDPAATSSILTLLDTPMGSPIPITLTAWDLSFLRAYYASTDNRYAEYQRAQMKGIMKRELDRQEATQP